MIDKIIISDCHFGCHIGCTALERASRQDILLDIEYSYDNKKAARSDSVKDAINYCEVYDLATSFAEKSEFKLIETLVERLAELLLARFPINSILLRLKKPGAMVGRNAAWAGIEIYRSNNK